jgi:hypothetical protein
MIGKPMSLALAGCLACFLTTTPAWGLGKPFEPGVTQLNTDELKILMAQEKQLVLINTLSPLEFRNRTIPGSVNVPYEHLKEGKSRDLVPRDPTVPLVFFCKGFK